MKVEDKYVYVIFDTWYETVICVHSEPEKECELCKQISIERLSSSSLIEYKHLIQTNFITD